MSSFRRSRQLLSGALLALVLFCQAALAVAGCASPERCPTMAFAGASCEHGRQDSAMTGNLCLAHATASDQSFAGMATAPAIPAMDITAGLVVPVVVMVPCNLPPIDEDGLVNASPPIPIRNCNLRN